MKLKSKPEPLSKVEELSHDLEEMKFEFSRWLADLPDERDKRKWAERIQEQAEKLKQAKIEELEKQIAKLQFEAEEAGEKGTQLIRAEPGLLKQLNENRREMMRLRGQVATAVNSQLRLREQIKQMGAGE